MSISAARLTPPASKIHAVAMPALCEAAESVVASVADSVSVPIAKPWLFRAGDPNNPAKVNPKAHRQPGTKNAQSALLRTAPKLVKKYIEKALKGDGDSAILIDSRKWILPVSEDAPRSGVNVVVFMGSGEQLPRLDAADTLSLVPASETAQPMRVLDVPPATLTPSAGTVDALPVPARVEA